MNKRQYIIIAIIAVVIIAAVWLGVKLLNRKNDSANNQNQTNSTAAQPTFKDRTELLRNLFSQKLGKTLADINISISREDDSLTHIQGILTVKGEGDRLFLAAKNQNTWEIAAYWDVLTGNYPCSDVEKYQFPLEMIADCTK